MGLPADLTDINSEVGLGTITDLKSGQEWLEG